MPKTILAGMTSHLAETVTTLCSIWKIIRRDGQSFFFTDHDVDVVFAGDTYLATNSYSRTAIEQDATMAVDNLDVVGIFDPGALNETELRAGLFDYAEVYISKVNYTDPDTYGQIKLRRGRFGQVQLTESGVFKTEIRGLLNNLQQNLLEVTGPECRANLGDSRCKIPIEPAEVQRNTAYSVGDYVKVNPNFAQPSGVELPLSNGDAETGDTTGWTNETGTLGVKSATPDPADGSYYFWGGTNALVRARQDVTVPAGEEAGIDAGERMFYAQWIQSSFSDLDKAELQVEFWDGTPATGTMLGKTKSGEQAGPSGSWSKFTIYFPFPAGTRVIRFRLRMQRWSGTNNDTYFDAIRAFSVPILDEVALTNPGGETGDTSGWTDELGSLGVKTINPNPFDGTYYFYGGANAETQAAQTVNVPAALYDAIDAGTVRLRASWLQASFAAQDTGGLQLVARNAAGTILDSTSVDFLAVDTQANWLQRVDTLTLPAGTRKISVKMRMHRVAGTNNDGDFDDIRVWYEDTSTVSSTSEIYSDRIYRCTQAGTTAPVQPIYDTVVGNTTVDGNVTTGAYFIAEEAWSRAAVVASVTSRKEFTITVTESRAVDDWFNGGAVTFETGNNAGISMEVRDWVNSTSTVKLFLAMPLDIQVGDALRLYPGCDRRRATCLARFNNVINFRGEPDLPGMDNLTRRDVK